MGHTRVVPNHGPVALSIFAVAQDTKVDAAIGGEGDALDDGRGQGGQQQQTEGDEEEDRQGGCRAQHDGELSRRRCSEKAGSPETGSSRRSVELGGRQSRGAGAALKSRKRWRGRSRKRGFGAGGR